MDILVKIWLQTDNLQKSSLIRINLQTCGLSHSHSPEVKAVTLWQRMQTSLISNYQLLHREESYSSNCRERSMDPGFSLEWEVSPGRLLSYLACRLSVPVQTVNSSAVVCLATSGNIQADVGCWQKEICPCHCHGA